MKKPVIVISSHVVRGSVGNRAAVLALETLQHPVWSVPTITLPWHPGRGAGTRIVPDDESFSALMKDLENAPWLEDVGGILSGYMASPEQVSAVASLVKARRVLNDSFIYICDPVIGDKDPESETCRLYVPDTTATAIKQNLIPICNIATPNRFELAWMTRGNVNASAIELAQTAKTLGPESVLVTSTQGMMRGNLGNLLVTESGATLAEHRLIDAVPNGTGDLTASVFLGNLMDGLSPSDALQKTTASVFEILTRTAKKELDELAIESEQISLTRPMAMVQMRDILIPKTK